jgi:hypothetical protein
MFRGTLFVSILCAALLASAGIAAAPPCGVAESRIPDGVSPVAVSLELRMVRLPEQTCERIGVDFKSVQGGNLDQEGLQRTLRLAKEDRGLSVMKTPTVSWSDKQQVNFHLADEGVDAALRVTPTVSADRRFIRLNLRLRREGAEDEKVEVVLSDGGSFVLPVGTALHETRQEFATPILSRIPYVNRLFTNVGYGRETEQVFLILTPRINVHAECPCSRHPSIRGQCRIP